MKRAIVYGSWKIRHAEPISVSESTILLYEMPVEAVNGASIAIDLRRALKQVWRVDGPVPAETSESRMATNLAHDFIPLGIVELRDDVPMQITHLLTRLERHKTHFITIAPRRSGFASLLPELTRAFDENHLILNNYECYYLKCAGSFARKISLENNRGGFYPLGRRFFEFLDNGKIDGFTPLLGDEFQLWNYHQSTYRILPNRRGVEGTFTLKDWAKNKKANWDQRFATVSCQFIGSDSRDCRISEEVVAYRDSPEETLVRHFGMPIARLSEQCNAYFGVNCESIGTGSIFTVKFGESRILQDLDCGSPRLWCEIQYEKSRGIPVEVEIERDFESLTEGTYEVLGVSRTEQPTLNASDI